MPFLPGVAVLESHPVAGRHQHRRGLIAPEQPPEPILGGLAAGQGGHVPAVIVGTGELGGEFLMQRANQFLGTQCRRPVVVIGDAEQDRLPGQADLAGLGRDDRGGIVGIVFEMIEPQPPDGVLRIEAILKREVQFRRPPDQEQVVRHAPFRVGRIGGVDAVTGQEIAGRLARLISVFAGEFPVERFRTAGGGLRLAVAQQRLERFANPRIGVMGEDHPPAGLGQVGLVDPRHDAEEPLAGLPGPGGQIPQQPDVGPRLGECQGGDLGDRHRRGERFPGRAVDAVEMQKLLGHGDSEVAW